MTTEATKPEVKTETTKETKDTKAAPKTPREVIERERAEHPIIPVAAHLPTDIDTPFPVVEPQKVTPEQKKKQDDKAALLKQIGEILKAHGDRESNIPAGNEYWNLIAKYRMTE